MVMLYTVGKLSLQWFRIAIETGSENEVLETYSWFSKVTWPWQKVDIIMCSSNRWLTIPPPGLSLFLAEKMVLFLGSGINIQWYPLGWAYITGWYSPGSGQEQQVIIRGKGIAWEVIIRGLDTQDEWCPSPFPGGGDGQPPIWTTHYMNFFLPD